MTDPGKPSIFTDETWGIVDLFGHQRIAGRLSEVSIAGCNMLRIDIPDKADTEKFRTVVHGGSAIYGIHFTDEQVARVAASRVSRPTYEYSVQEAIKQLQTDGARGRLVDTGFDDDN